jgi:hypothetical protein
MDSGYYSIAAILAEEDRVPVTFKIKAANLGFIDPGKAVIFWRSSCCMLILRVDGLCCVTKA